MLKARSALFQIHENLNLRPLIVIPKKFQIGLVKCRVTYGRQVEKIEYEKYVFHSTQHLQCVYSESLTYSHKYVDRNALHQLFMQKGAADNILIIVKQRVTDSYYANVAFYDGDTWYTPSAPLLHGTRRQKLLDTHKIVERSITVSDIHNYQKISLFNAMIPFQQLTLDIASIKL